MNAPQWWEDLQQKFPPRKLKPRTCLYLQDKGTGDNVEIVSDSLEVKAEPVKERTSGDQ